LQNLAECLIWINEENVLLVVDLVWQKVSLREFSQGPSLRDGMKSRQINCWDAICERVPLQTGFTYFAGVHPLGPENGAIVGAS